MAKITLMVEGSTVGTVASGGGVVIENTVSEADSARIVAAYARSNASRWLDDKGAPRAPTAREVVEVWFAGILAASAAHVVMVEREVAADMARAAVKPITLS